MCIHSQSLHVMVRRLDAPILPRRLKSYSPPRFIRIFYFLYTIIFLYLLLPPSECSCHPCAEFLVSCPRLLNPTLLA